MTLHEVLKQNASTITLTRQAWIDGGRRMKLFTSARTIEELEITLTPDSFIANDWLIIPQESQNAL